MPPVVINLSTTVSVSKTVAEIEDLLRVHGVQQVTKVYDAGTPTGLSFVCVTSFGPREFKLPVKVDAIYLRLREARKRWPRLQHEIRALEWELREQAKRSAWRLLLDWLRAHLSVLELDMPIEQGLLAFMVADHDGATVYEKAKETLLLPQRGS